MDSFLNKAAIIETLHTLALATDDLDMPLLTSVFAPDRKIPFDVSKHLGYPPQELLGPQIVEMQGGLIPGFTATEHLVGNPIVTLLEGGNAAKALAYVTAYHCIQDGEGTPGSRRDFTMRGRWDVRLDKVEGSWKVTRMRVARSAPLEKWELELYGIAVERVRQGRGRPTKAR